LISALRASRACGDMRGAAASPGVSWGELEGSGLTDPVYRSTSETSPAQALARIWQAASQSDGSRSGDDAASLALSPSRSSPFAARGVPNSFSDADGVSARATSLSLAGLSAVAACSLCKAMRSSPIKCLHTSCHGRTPKSSRCSTTSSGGRW